MFKIKPLDGTYTLIDDTSFTVNGWFSGKYQEHREKYLRDHFEFRSDFIRCNNQVDYSLFHKFHTGDIVEGKNNFLFNIWYIDSYQGHDFIGTPKINNTLTRLKLLQDTLTKLHKTLLIIFSPSKDFYYPENLPNGTVRGDSLNYDVYVKLAKAKGLNFIDFEKYFIEEKMKGKYPLFTAYGSHWSYYGACLAGDSIINSLEKTSPTKMPHIIWKNNIVASEAENDELELEKEFNLFIPLKKEILGHPQLKDTSNVHEKRPSILIIGDSYIFNLEAHYNIESSFSKYTFCYYYKTVYVMGAENTFETDKFNLRDAIEQADFILVESTEINLNKFGWGFTDEACKAFGIDTEKYKIN